MGDEIKSWWDAVGELVKSILKTIFGNDEENKEEGNDN